MTHRLQVAAALAGVLLAATLPPAQAAAESDDESEDDFFLDPFAVSGEADGPSADAETGSTSLFDLDFDSLFGDREMIDVADESTMAANPQEDLLRTSGVRWGGRIRGSLDADWNWDTVGTPEFRLTEPAAESLSPRLGADLFFDSRPTADFRAFGNFKLDLTSPGTGVAGIGLGGLTGATNLPAGWTSEENADGDTEIRDGNGTLITTIAGDDDEAEDDEPMLGQAPGLALGVFELFADYVYRDELFFRFGKHTIKWGTGYFWSPADVLNLSAVDAEDPTDDREGPLSLRALYPFGRTGNAWLYLITNTGATLADVAVAPKIEFAVGNGEVGIGAYYQRSLAPRAVLLYSGSVRDVDLFGEAALLRGADRVFVRPSRDQSAAADPDDDLDLVLDTFEVDRGLFLHATVGARYIKEFDDGPTLVAVGQYFFNGTGYASTVPGLLLAAGRLVLNPGENGLALPADEQPDGYTAPPTLGFGDLSNWGRHYAGGTVSVSGWLAEDLSLALFGLMNLTDLSGIVMPSVSFRFLDRFSLGLSAGSRSVRPTASSPTPPRSSQTARQSPPSDSP